MTYKFPVNIPNILSLYRLLSFPFILWMVLVGEENLFAVFLCFNLITDILDGLIARAFKLQTDIGARLDSLADIGTEILAFTGIYFFKLEEITASFWMLWLYIGLILLYNLISIIKFGKTPSLHLYAMKIGGYVQGIFFFILFVWGFSPVLFYLAMCIGYYASIEEIIILFISDELQSNVKGLFWILKARRKVNTE